jgi:hypothetical protein
MTMLRIIPGEASGDNSGQARVSPECRQATRSRRFRSGRHPWRHHATEVPMRQAFILAVSGLLFAQFLVDDAAARGGFHGGFGGGGFRGGGFIGGGFARGGFGRPAFAGAGFVRPGWHGGGVRWGGGWGPGWGPRSGWGWRAANVGLRPGWGWRPGWNADWRWRRGWGPGWGWRAASVGLGFGALAAAPFFSSFGYDDCPVVGRRVWDGFGPRVVWVSSCDLY